MPTPDDAREPNVEPEPDLHEPRVHAALDRYWRDNVLVTIALLAGWAIAGLGCGVLFADQLNVYRVGISGLFTSGFPLGFWFAHQGSIMIFVLLILAYCLLANRLDARHHRELEELQANGGPEA